MEKQAEQAFMLHQSNTLGQMANLLNDLGIDDTKLIEPTEDVPFYVLLAYYAQEGQAQDYALTCLYYPGEELSRHDHLVQFFLQLPNGLMPADEALVARVLPYVNNALPFGHFSLIPQDDGFWYINYRYVHAVSINKGFDKEGFADMMSLIVRLPLMYDLAFQRLIKKEFSVTEFFQFVEKGAVN